MNKKRSEDDLLQLKQFVELPEQVKQIVSQDEHTLIPEIFVEKYPFEHWETQLKLERNRPTLHDKHNRLDIQNTQGVIHVLQRRVDASAKVPKGQDEALIQLLL